MRCALARAMLLTVHLTINGEDLEVRAEPRRTLVDLLREDLNLTEIGRASCRERV